MQKLNVLLFNANNFLVREVQNALSRRSEIQLTVINLPYHITEDSANKVFEEIKKFLPALVFSLNWAGYDYRGKLASLILDSGSYQINWFYDDPFFDEIFFQNILPVHQRRIDFVTEPTFVPLLKLKGYQAYFLPLAAAPEFFNTNGEVAYERDVAFVGNSSLELVDTILGKNIVEQLEQFGQLIQKLREMYFNNPTVNLKRYLLEHPQLWEKKISIEPEKFLFSIQWMVEFFYRRDFIVGIWKRFGKRFTCFGDISWNKYIDSKQVSTAARYYENLCHYYRSTKVNLNLNRIQIRTAFTQRIFDCKACGAFLLTDKRPLNSHFFVTEGPQRELVEFSSLQECAKLIDYFLEADEEREQIALAGRQKVLSSHTYDHRIEYIFEICKKVWGI